MPTFLLTLFLLLVGVIIPWLAWQSHRHLRDGHPLPPFPEILLQTVLLQGVLLAGALLASAPAGLHLPLGLHVPTAGYVAGLGWLGVAAMTVPFRDAIRPAWERARTEAMIPRTTRDRVGWVGLVAVASMSEEIVYRGTLFGFLNQALGGWWLPAIVTALVFGLAHLVQGLRAALIVVAFGLGFQAVAFASGTLIVPMAVHFLWDLSLGVFLIHNSPTPQDSTIASPE